MVITELVKSSRTIVVTLQCTVIPTATFYFRAILLNRFVTNSYYHWHYLYN